MRVYTIHEIARVMADMIAPQIVNPALTAFWAWEAPGRVVISINPHNVKSHKVVMGPDFSHALATRLGGARVVRTNSIGLFYQVGYEPQQPARLDSRPLDLSEQPDPLAVPFGLTASGPLWPKITELGSVLIGGSKGMGKTSLMHAWIQALIHGGECDLVLHDGPDKGGLEFDRYAHEPGVTCIDDLGAELNGLQKIIAERRKAMLTIQANGIDAYNARVPAEKRLRPVVLFVDEVAGIDRDTESRLAQLIAVSRAFGIIQVLATQRTGVSEVSPLAKTNLVTRIAFPVPAMGDSQTILARSGAEKLPKIPGRLATVWHGRMIEAQAYSVTLPGMPDITADEIGLANWAIAQHGGRLSIPRLVERGMSEWDARELLNVWSSRGWLTGGGQGVTRRVSPALEALLSTQPTDNLENGAI
jgi:hypothetical protein